eukprot:TRINITY_DN1157_c0_g2_i1.p2 TRINITY_DN1157_c0_g2~~TRINITY_DN1157_c0_g2_i1.p2  ORF type:complete len:342 (-),score=62.18 TRINITY_DN1157_c0_g2_i1:1730-2755(-)
MVMQIQFPRIRYILDRQQQHFLQKSQATKIIKIYKTSRKLINKLSDKEDHHSPTQSLKTKQIDLNGTSDIISQNPSNKTQLNSDDSDSDKNQSENEGNSAGLYAFGTGLAGILILLGVGYLLQDQIKAFLDFFIHAVENWGIWGCLAYGIVYAGLEVLAVPAIPLTMTAGVIFGVIPGTMIVSLAGTIAATISFLIARYLARDRVMKFVGTNPKLAAIDKAIGKDGFRVVVLLRLSPLLPLAASNYFYGLTSVELVKYVCGSWLGMLPGTFAYVFAGRASRDVFLEGGQGTGLVWWQIALGVGTTILALLYVGRVAKKALEKYEENDVAEIEYQQQEQPHT